MIKKVIIVIVFLLILVVVILIARGYRFDFASKSLRGTGILALSSSPKPAEVYLNGIFNTATDSNISVATGDYEISIKKEGYTTYKKKTRVFPEAVVSVDGLLFPKNPSLFPITNVGIVRAEIISDDAILLFSQTGDVEKDGIYVYTQDKRALSLTSPLKMIVSIKNLPKDIDFKKIGLEVSPDFTQILLSTDKLNPKVSQSFLIVLSGENTNLLDISNSKETILSLWQTERAGLYEKQIKILPANLELVATQSAKIISLSPDKTKALYIATSSAELKRIINPPLLGANQTPEVRTLKKGDLYVYDIKEDKNFKITFTPDKNKRLSESTLEQCQINLDIECIKSKLDWYFNSRHLVVRDEKQFHVMEYDNDNQELIYSGINESSFFDIDPDGRLLILANLNPNSNTNADLYAVGIK